MLLEKAAELPAQLRSLRQLRPALVESVQDRFILRRRFPHMAQGQPGNAVRRRPDHLGRGDGRRATAGTNASGSAPTANLPAHHVPGTSESLGHDLLKQLRHIVASLLPTLLEKR